MADDRWSTTTPEQLEKGELLARIAEDVRATGAIARCFSCGNASAVVASVRSIRELADSEIEMPDDAEPDAWLVVASCTLTEADQAALFPIISLQMNGPPGWLVTPLDDPEARPIDVPLDAFAPPPKRGEGQDNLRDRAEWFRGRSGPGGRRHK